MARRPLTREIRCPRCDGLARFETPFEFIGGPTPKASDPSWDFPRYGGWFVRVRHPSLIPWTNGEDYLAHTDRGVSLCTDCRDIAVHRLQWPARILEVARSGFGSMGVFPRVRLGVARVYQSNASRLHRIWRSVHCLSQAATDSVLGGQGAREDREVD